MGNKAHLNVLKKGVWEWNQWRGRNPNVRPDFIGADLRGMNLHGAFFQYAILDGADLAGADLGYSFMHLTSLNYLDLSRVKGLERVQHLGPSSIGIDTIYRSGGNIPEAFLRGAGVPEAFITYMKSLVVSPIEYYSCFISYSSKYEEFAKKLHRDLLGEQVQCWFAPEDLKIGDEIRPGIDEAIRIHDKLLIVLSENSVGSPWVRKEVETAFGKEIKFETEQKQRRTVLFPIRLDDAVMKTGEAWGAGYPADAAYWGFPGVEESRQVQRSLGAVDAGFEGGGQRQ